MGAIATESDVLCIVPNDGAERKKAEEVRRSLVTKPP